jgi:Fe-S-cluster containining protein
MKFSCKNCGKCCQGNGFVYLELKNVIDISNYLKIKRDDFIKNFLNCDGDDKYYLGGINKPCPFYENECKIYEVRPYQCRCYPFWYYIVRSKKDWNNEAKLCKGMTKIKDGI